MTVTLKRIGFFCFPIKHSTHTIRRFTSYNSVHRAQQGEGQGGGMLGEGQGGGMLEKGKGGGMLGEGKGGMALHIGRSAKFIFSRVLSK